MAKTKEAETITVRQTGSPIRRKPDQRQTLVGLGLNKLGREKTLENTPAVRGMIRKVGHMVAVRQGEEWVGGEAYIVARDVAGEPK